MGLIDGNKYNNAKASAGGDFPRMTAGGYVCAIQAVRTQGEDSYHRPINYIRDKQYVKFIFDVVEGEHAGRFSDEYWQGEDKDWGHQFFISFKDVNYDEQKMGFFKANMQAFDESNPGFEAFPAFDAEQFGLFIGKKIGLVFGEEEYIGNDGTVKTRLMLPRLKSVQDIRNGKFRVPALKKLKESERPTAQTPTAAPAADVYDDIPFS